MCVESNGMRFGVIWKQKEGRKRREEEQERVDTAIGRQVYTGNQDDAVIVLGIAIDNFLVAVSGM